jgi:hypothetical protein
MTTEKRLCLLAACLLSACALKAPPTPEPIVCDEIERAEERFPEECSDAGIDAEPDAPATDSDD